MIEKIATMIKFKCQLNTIPNVTSFAKSAYWWETRITVEIMPNLNNLRSIFTVQDVNTLKSKIPEGLMLDEHVLIALFTPTLVAICREVGLDFVNSEENPWIRFESGEKENHLKPGGLSSIPHIFEIKPESRKFKDELNGALHPVGQLRRDLVAGNIPFEDVFLFGNGIWEIKDFFIVWDFKI
jgi:hypothetical protein